MISFVTPFDLCDALNSGIGCVSGSVHSPCRSVPPSSEVSLAKSR